MDIRAVVVNTDMPGRTASGSAASQSNGSHEELFEGEKKDKEEEDEDEEQEAEEEERA